MTCDSFVDLYHHRMSVSPMLASSSKTGFPFLSRSSSPNLAECSDIESDSESSEEVDFSPIILCAECLHTFSCSKRTYDSATLAKVRAKYIPADPETAGIQMQIEDLDKDLSKYDLEIKWLERALKKLKRQRDSLKRCQAECETLLSPIRRLPPEILSQIFDYHCQIPISLEGWNSNKWADDLVVDAPALSLSQVCSFWRELSLSTPILWSSLRINLQWHMGYGPIQLLNLFLHYSGSTPLNLQVMLGYGDTNSVIFDSLVDFSHRWQTVVLECTGELLPINFPTQKRFPLLTSLSWKYGYLPDLHFFQCSNTLRHLSVENTVFETDTLTISPFEQLKTMMISEQTTPQTLYLLHKSSGLESVEINLCHRVFPILDHYVVQLNHLTTLVFSAGDCQEIFSWITTPRLTSLTINAYSGQYAISPARFLLPVNIILEFLSRSSSGGVNILEQLKLDRVELSDSELLDILRLTPRLKNLSVRDVISDNEPQIPPAPGAKQSITNSFIHSLIITQHMPKSRSMSQSKTLILPELHTLDLVTPPSRIDNGLLVDMVASRSQSDLGVGLLSSLRSVSVRQGYIWSDSLKESESHFLRPVVNLEPVMLADSDLGESDETTSPHRGIPDPGLMDENEIAFWKGGSRFSLVHAEQGTGVKLDEEDEGIVGKVKDRILNCLWWGGSISLPELSFVRLVSGVL
ncbi:hypothetical protein VKT23_008218 [Stygiomarasmius scandens]|uniref:F-box domain-containing protein n=1 Tax=Marasmiellus scandens TaxID=2682957 RepID=A0ABR1JIH4_9AGAR